MPLQYPGPWRFNPPTDGAFINSAMPREAVNELLDSLSRIHTPHSRKWVLEIFKSNFGAVHGSSSESWAYSDLSSAMDYEASNAPHFIECFFDGCQEIVRQGFYAPDEAFINSVLRKYNVGYEIRGDELVAKEQVGPMVQVSAPPPSLAESARKTLEESLSRSEQLLAEGHGREAVQEVLWLLETISTAFRGVETPAGRIEGKYFNKIVGDLRKRLPGTTFERVLSWIDTMHGYLSAPGGGGVRHGKDLDSNVDLDLNQARLFCNLTRSYVSYLIGEYDVMVQRGGLG